MLVSFLPGFNRPVYVRVCVRSRAFSVFYGKSKFPIGQASIVFSRLKLKQLTGLLKKVLKAAEVLFVIKP